MHPVLRQVLRCFVFYGAACTAVLVAQLLGPSAGYAEFMMTMASGVYQHSAGHTKVVVSSKQGAEGVFILEGGEVALQEFDLEKTPREGTKSVFVRFDPDANPAAYSELVLGQQRYKISGNLTLKLGQHTSVAIDNNNPYLSVVVDQPGAAPAIVGFLGATEVVRGTGNAAIILAANQLDAKIAALIKPYVVGEEGVLFNGKPLAIQTVGTFVKPDNSCLEPNSIVLMANERSSLREQPDEAQRAATLEKIIESHKKRSPLKDHLILKSDQSGVLLLDIKGQNVRFMSPLTESPSVGSRKVCVINDLDLRS